MMQNPSLVFVQTLKFVEHQWHSYNDVQFVQIQNPANHGFKHEDSHPLGQLNDRKIPAAV